MVFFEYLWFVYMAFYLSMVCFHLSVFLDSSFLLFVLCIDSSLLWASYKDITAIKYDNISYLSLSFDTPPALLTWVEWSLDSCCQLHGLHSHCFAVWTRLQSLSPELRVVWWQLSSYANFWARYIIILPLISHHSLHISPSIPPQVQG